MENAEVIKHAAVNLKLEEVEKKFERLKNFWKPVLDKFETSNAHMAMDALTSAFDVHTENEDLKLKLSEAIGVIRNFQKKTEVYLTIYTGDKELKKYRDDADDLIKKHGLEKV